MSFEDIKNITSLYLNIDLQENPVDKLVKNPHGVVSNNIYEFRNNVIDKIGHNLLRYIVFHTILKYTLEYCIIDSIEVGKGPDKRTNTLPFKRKVRYQSKRISDFPIFALATHILSKVRKGMNKINGAIFLHTVKMIQ